MALLSVEKRKEYFKYLGLGTYCEANILKMQKKHMYRKSDHDGIYGPDTDALLRHLRNCKKYAPSFHPDEFRCGCRGKYCCGFPTRMKAKELAHIQAIRNHFGKPMVITSGLRCKGFNDTLRGASKASRHLTGFACDFYAKGLTDSVKGRNKVIKYAKKLKHHHYTYGNGVKDSNGFYIDAPNMGNAVHTDTR